MTIVLVTWVPSSVWVTLRDLIMNFHWFTACDYCACNMSPFQGVTFSQFLNKIESKVLHWTTFLILHATFTCCLFRKHLKLQKSQDLRLDVDDDNASCISFFLNMIVFIMILNFLFRKHMKLQKSQDLEFFWFFNESELMLMMITLVAFCFSDTWT